MPDAEAAAAAAAALLVEAADADGSIVLAGGSTLDVPTSSPRSGTSTGAAPSCGTATTAACRASDERSTSASCRRRSSTGCSCRPSCTRSPRGSRPTRRRPPTTPSCAGRSSTSSCSASAPTGTRRRCSRTRPRWRSGNGSRSRSSPGLEPFVERITLTIPALESAGHVVFLVVGEGKATRCGEAFAQEPSPATPASLVRSAAGRHDAILDERRGRRCCPERGRYRGAEPLARRRARGARSPRAGAHGDRDGRRRDRRSGVHGALDGVRALAARPEAADRDRRGRDRRLRRERAQRRLRLAGIAGEARVYAASGSARGDLRAERAMVDGIDWIGATSSARRSTAAG